MLLRALKEHHFAIYQTLLALAGLTAVLMILGSYSFVTALLYSFASIGSFTCGWWLVAFIQRERSRRRRRSYDLD